MARGPGARAGLERGCPAHLRRRAGGRPRRGRWGGRAAGGGLPEGRGRGLVEGDAVGRRALRRVREVAPGGSGGVGAGRRRGGSVWGVWFLERGGERRQR